MIKFVSIPNLPKGKVCKIICGTSDPFILDFFSHNGIEVLTNDVNPFIDKAVSNHADMAALHLGKNQIIVDKAQNTLKSRLVSCGFSVIESEKDIKGKYPGDIGLNFTFINKFAAGNFKYADNELLKRIDEKHRINVRQGYCKCSVLVVDENSIITDDESIHRAALNNNVNSLLISKGDVSLEGHEYGFIGGASGKIEKNKVVFFGNIYLHRNFSEIEAFLSACGCTYICTDNKNLRDIGGIIPLTEE